jgi:hypothetical protein
VGQAGRGVRALAAGEGLSRPRRRAASGRVGERRVRRYSATVMPAGIVGGSM